MSSRKSFCPVSGRVLFWNGSLLVLLVDIMTSTRRAQGRLVMNTAHNTPGRPGLWPRICHNTSAALLISKLQVRDRRTEEPRNFLIISVHRTSSDDLGANIRQVLHVWIQCQQYGSDDQAGRRRWRSGKYCPIGVAPGGPKMD